MPDEQVNSGSFGAAAGGGGSNVLAAIQRRAPGGVLNQTTAGSPSNNPAVQPQLPPAQGAALPLPTAQATPSSPQASNGLPVGNPEAQVILRALDNRLKTISTIDKANSGIMK